MEKSKIKEYFNKAAEARDKWRKKNWYYHRDMEAFYSFAIPEGSSILDIGCATGDLLANLKPNTGAGIDISENMVKIAKSKYPHLEFQTGDVENLNIDKKYDFIIMQDLIGNLSDVWLAFRNLRLVTHPKTRVVITYYNHLWEPAILLAEKIGLKMKQPYQNWLALDDIGNLLYLNNYEIIKKGYRFLCPFYIPFVSDFINKYIAKLPFVKDLCLVGFIVAKESAGNFEKKEYSFSVIIPCRNEAANIEPAVERVPFLGKGFEIIFVDGNSSDGTIEKIKEMIEKHREKKIKLVLQGGAFGKADAVRKGFDAATGDILMILDADITVPPEDLSKFYIAISEGKGEFINGTRLVYPMEKEAMRTLNMIGNKIFSIIFTWILEQRIKDTLCGTKVFLREDYLKIKANRSYFGDFDPFGDYDLLFGAAKLNLKIVEMPVRYRERVYGTTKISRFTHGLLLLKMCWTALIKFKFR